ncbi:hypothetical protein P0136_11425 [Lentisphaerota bacterium ZTH]|nr:hypothetical protein JYG24_11055 [Lentisphaerota bacterium]WET05968.1 hypothetical protein P0136_11425 [Lentisphaerota bacterium ZTH]
MSDFKRIPVRIDAASGKQIDEGGKPVREAGQIRLLFDETVILCCEFFDVKWNDGTVAVTPHLLKPSLTIKAFGDNDFNPETTFMFLTEQNNTAPDYGGINKPGDWFNDSTADLTQGQLSVRVNTNTARFSEAVKTSGACRKFYFCITGIPSGQTANTVLAYFQFKAENRPSSSSGAPVPADPDYLDAQAVRALVKTAPEFQFSIDGSTSWHGEQSTHDCYYRERRNGGEWSAAIRLIEGKPGLNGVGINYLATYNGDTEYAKNDAVTFQGSLFVSLTDNNSGNTPDASSANWQLSIAKGNKGDQGEQGPKGDQGNKGEQGDQGVIGDQGDTGKSAFQSWLDAGNAGTEADFLTALKGAKGDTGEKGDEGNKGEQGDQGIKGDKGDTGNPGKSAYQVWLDAGNTGTEAAFLAALKGAEGDKGSKGDAGEKGDQGDIGEKGDKGDTGNPGKSAYQVWLDAGNAGTEAAFLAALEGAKGDTGEKGEKGDSGMSNPSLLTNGDFHVWQRGEMFNAAAAGQFTADRWRVDKHSTVTVNVSRAGDALKFEKANSVNSFCNIQQPVDLEVNPISNGETFAVSYEARRISGTVNINPLFSQTADGTTTFVTGAAPALTASFQRFSVTMTTSFSGSLTAFALLFAVTTDTSGVVEIRNVKLERGNTATPFEQSDYTSELVRCRRYFRRQTLRWRQHQSGEGYSVVFDPPMRATPTLAQVSGPAIPANGELSVGPDSFHFGESGSDTAIKVSVYDFTAEL